MFDRFTDNAKKAMNGARQEAQRRDHDYLGAEHILLALTGMPECTAAKALRAEGVAVEQVRAEVEGRLMTNPHVVTMGQMPFTPSAKKVLELSMQEASDLEHRVIGTEHLLLGIIAGDDEIAASALRRLGCDSARMRRAVLELHIAEPGSAVREMDAAKPDPRRPIFAEARILKLAADILRIHGKEQLADQVEQVIPMLGPD